jgi:hypothetical protein
MVDADAHPPLVGGQVIDPVRSDLAQFLVLEVPAADPFRLPLRLPLPARILEIPHQFLLLRVHRDDRLSSPLEGAHLAGDVFKLSIPVGMAAPLPGLAIGLETVTHVPK